MTINVTKKERKNNIEIWFYVGSVRCSSGKSEAKFRPQTPKYPSWPPNMDLFPAAGLTETSSLKLWPWQERKKGLKKEKKNEGEHLIDVETGLEAKATTLKSCYGSKKVEKKKSSNEVIVIVKSRSHTTFTYQHFYIPNICCKYWQKKKVIKCVPAETGLYCPQLEEEITRESSF